MNRLHKILTQGRQYFLEETRPFLTLLKWLILALLTGTIVGLIASGFAHAVRLANEFHHAHPLLILGLPLSGLAIVWLYRRSGQGNNTGTNLVLTAIRSEEPIPGPVTPLILLATILTHLFGGSSGREGAALQFGASVSDFLARKLHLNSNDRKTLLLTGMSAAFSALFGTPIAAVIFAMEVASVGVMYYSALVPCVFSAFLAQKIALLCHVRILGIPYLVENVPAFYSLNALKILLPAVCFAFAGVLFCVLLHSCEHGFKKYFSNAYLRVAFGGTAVALLYFLLRTDAYLGLGEETILASFSSPAVWNAFLLKILFTCLTLCAGFKGGEIVPSLFIGSTLGSFLSLLCALPTDLVAACGMVGVFCSVTNCPLASLFIAVELFGTAGLPYYCVVISICYLISGYHSLYRAQKIVYSKTENRYVNRETS